MLQQMMIEGSETVLAVENGGGNAMWPEPPVVVDHSMETFHFFSQQTSVLLQKRASSRQRRTSQPKSPLSSEGDGAGVDCTAVMVAQLLGVGFECCWYNTGGPSLSLLYSKLSSFSWKIRRLAKGIVGPLPTNGAPESQK